MYRSHDKNKTNAWTTNTIPAFPAAYFLYCLNTCTLMGTSWQISESKTGYSVILKIKHNVWMKVQDYMTRNL